MVGIARNVFRSTAIGHNRTYGLVLQSGRPQSNFVQGTLTTRVPSTVVAYGQVLRYRAANFTLAIGITE